jgi:hypothetical protein
VAVLAAFAMSYSCDCLENKNIMDILYIYICCCYAVAMLVQFCGYVAVMLLICCCCVAAMLLLCRCYAFGMSFCFAAMLLLY